MANSSRTRSTSYLIHAALVAVLALSNGAGCAGHSDSGANGGAAGAPATAGATSSSSGGMSAGGSNAAAGAHTGGASSSAGARNGGAGGALNTTGGAANGGACSQITTQAECGARADCYEILKTILCPGSGAACPTQFVRCADTGCDPACDATSVCVGVQVLGGAINPFADAGPCPAGTHADPPGHCVADPTYSCKPIPTACSSQVSCACAQTLCSMGPCESSSAGQLNCIEAVP